MHTNVKPIYDDYTPRRKPDRNSNCHFGYHSGGHPYWYAQQIAENISKSLREANTNPDPTSAKYSTIELAIIPYPGKPGFFYVENRSTRCK